MCEPKPHVGQGKIAVNSSGEHRKLRQGSRAVPGDEVPANKMADASMGESANLWTTPSDETFSFTNFPPSCVSYLHKDGCPFLAVVLCCWDNVLGPRLSHVWRGSGDEKTQQESVKYVVSRTLNGELLRDAPENVIDSKMFVLKDKGIICFTSIFTGRDKTGPNISALSLIVPYSQLKEFLPLVELIEERVKILIAKLRVLQAKALPTSTQLFSSYLPAFIQTIRNLQSAGIPQKIPLADTAFGLEHNKRFDPSFLRRAITSHLQTFGSTIVIGKDMEDVNLVRKDWVAHSIILKAGIKGNEWRKETLYRGIMMINTLAMFLSPEERRRSRYPVHAAAKAEADAFDPDLFVQGLLKGEDGSFSLSVKGVITSLWPSTLVDTDSAEVKQTHPYNEHAVIRHDFLDLELTLLWQGQEDAPVFPSMGLFHTSEEIALSVQTFMSDINLLPSVQCGVREGFIADFMRILDRKALALIKYVEAKSNQGASILDHSAVHQLRLDFKFLTDADFTIVLIRAEKLKPGVLSFLMGDPRRSVSKVQALLESL